MPGQALALQGFPGIVYIKRGGIPVADIEAGDHNVQFLCINIERKTGSDIDGSEKNQNGTDGHLEL